MKGPVAGLFAVTPAQRHPSASSGSDSDRNLLWVGIRQPSAQAVLAEHLYGACLWSFIAHLLEKRDARAGCNLLGVAIEDAVSVKVDLAAVLRLQKTETAGVVKAFHGRDRRAVMGFDVTAHAPRLVLQPPSRALECSIDGHDRVGEAIVSFFEFFGAADIDFSALG